MEAVLDRLSLGQVGEDLACRELARLGYRILARRYRTRFGEIDIIASEGGAVVFVEVKARRSATYGEAAESIPSRKRRRIGAMALDYLAWTGRLNSPCRFDVVAIDGFGRSGQKIRVIPNAFSLDGS
jgi:putative endonuclease